MGTAKVIVLEDEPLMRGMLRSVLDIAGLEAVILPSTEGVLEKMRDCDCVISDLGMHNGSIYRFLDNVRENNPGVRVVLMSGDPGKLEEVFSSEKGKWEEGKLKTFPKPFNMVDMIISLREE